MTAVKKQQEAPMPKEQQETLNELAEVVKEMELGRAEDERERRRAEIDQKRQTASARRRVQRRIKESQREVRTRETETAELRRAISGLERDEELLITRKLRRDEKFDAAFAKVRSKESEKNLQRLSKRTETAAAHEKMTHLKTSLRSLEVNQIQALKDDPRGSRSPSTARATVLELEVAELQKDSIRLNEENAKLRQELEKVKPSLSPQLREKVNASMMAAESDANQKKPPAFSSAKLASVRDAVQAQKSVTSSPGRMNVQTPWGYKDGAADTVASTAVSYSAPQASYSLPMSMVARPGFSGIPTAGMVEGGILSAPGFAWGGPPRSAVASPVRAPPKSTTLLSEAPLSSTTLNTATPSRQPPLSSRPIGPWAWSTTGVEAAPAVPVGWTPYLSSQPGLATVLPQSAVPSRLATPSANLRSPSGSPIASRPVLRSMGLPLSPGVPARFASSPSSAALPLQTVGATPSLVPSPIVAPRASPLRTAPLTTSLQPRMASSVASTVRQHSQPSTMGQTPSTSGTARSESGNPGFAAVVHKLNTQALHDYRLNHAADD